MKRYQEIAFQFALLSQLSMKQHRQHAERIHMAIVEWAESQLLCVGGGLEVRKCDGGSLSLHRLGLSAKDDEQLVDFSQAQALFDLIRTMSIASDMEIVGGYHLFPPPIKC